MARGDTKLAGFYFPWPLRNIQFARQINQSRENTEKIAPLVRGVYVDPQPVTANDPGNHDVSGWAHGKRDFRNKYRIWYDQDNLRWALQHNVGTEAIEVWDDVITARESDGRVTIVGFGGLDAPGGFYAPVPRNLAVSSTFNPASTEWVFQHNLDTKPILWNAFNMEDKSAIPQTVDVSDPNIAYFYWAVAQAGRAIVVAEQARGEGINIDDGSNGNIFNGATRLGFNPDNFYLSNEGHGDPVVNLQPIDISDIDPDTIPVNLIVTDTDASQTFDLSLLPQPKIVFHRDDFYFASDVDGNPIINIRGGTGGSGTGNTAQAASFVASNEWVFAHGLNNSDLNWSAYDDQGFAIIPGKVSVHDPNTAYFYFGTNAMSGRAVVTAAGGTTSIDTSPFIRKDGTVAFTADESMGGFKLTNVGTPTNSTDAANKAYVDAAGLTVSDDVHTFTTNKITFGSGGFYLDHDSAGKAVVNLRIDTAVENIPVFVEAPQLQNVVIDTFAPYNYTVEEVIADNKSGSCTVGFYILRSNLRNRNGIAIGNLDPVAVSTTVTTKAPTGSAAVSRGDALLMSIYGNSSSKHLRLSLRLRRT